VGEGARSAFDTGFAEAAYGLDRKVVLCGEVVVGLDRLEALIGLLKAPSDGRILVDTQVVDRGLALVSACYLVDEPGSPIVMRDVPATVRLSQASVRCGGRPYGIGIWNGPFANSILGKRRKSLQVIKSETDRLRTLNPGKFFSMTTSSGLPVWNWTYKIGLGMIEIL
jgi:hypothetical protein